MGYLDKSTVTVDAILTKRGRQLLASGDGGFQITKFAVSDDEINYDLWDVNHAKGTNYYGQAIENMPMVEAVPSEDKVMRYKLMTLPKNTMVIPTMITSPTSEINIQQGSTTVPSFTTVTISINPASQAGSQYNVFVSDVSICYASTTGNTPPGQSVGTQNFVLTDSNPNVPGVTFVVTARSLLEAKTTTLTISSVSTGNIVQLQVNVGADPTLQL